MAKTNYLQEFMLIMEKDGNISTELLDEISKLRRKMELDYKLDKRG